MPPTQPTIDWSGFLPYISLGGGVLIPTYFVVTSLAFCICLFWMVRRADRFHLSRNLAIDAALVLMSTGFVGSRLFHIFFEEPRYYIENPIRALQFWRGGFVWYGGAIAGSLSTLLFLKIRRQNLGLWLDFFAPIGALGYTLGRTACLFAGCCYGRIFELPGFLGRQTMRHPTQAYAMATETLTLFILLWLERRKLKGELPDLFSEPGRLFFIWLILHGLGRIVMESFRADPRGPELLHLSVSTWVSLFLIAFSMRAIQKPFLGK